ncbi:MAG TPA: hypothetical protein VF662_09720 [Allosphingosinicella sp.]|jgi:hypothetical protein
MVAATSIQAQDTNTVGNPQLKDFELPGTRSTPPAKQQQPAPATTAPPAATVPPATAPAPAATPPADRAAPPPAAAAPGTTPAPSAARPRSQAPARPAPTAAAPAPTAPPAEAPAGLPAPTELEQALPAPAPVTAEPKTQWQPPAAAPASAPAQGFPWLYVGGAALLALLALAALFAFKRSRPSTEPEGIAEPVLEEPQAAPGPDPLFARRAPAPAPDPAPTPVPSPAPAAAPPTDGFVGISMRPRLELEFKPDRAAATLTETSVQFGLTIRNTGNRIARDIRIQIQMVNAGPDQDREIEAFFAQAASRDDPAAIQAIPPGSEARINTSVTLPKDRIRELIVQGRQLFIPVIAFNVFYEWDEGRVGQTSMSYIVGREAPSPQERMGAFRLDLGPRLYRQVDQRQANLAKVV